MRAVRTRDISSDSPAGRVRARLYLPPHGTPSKEAALVWVHGGAFFLGGLDQKEAHWVALELAAAGIPVLSADYRMCLRGVHYPTPQDEVLAAWRWAMSHHDELGVQPGQLHLGGASAGGCLAAGATLRLRDDGSLPASLVLAYPMLEGRLAPPTAEAAPFLSGIPHLVTDEWVADAFANWAGPSRWDDPYVSPALADLMGLPPVYVLTCGLDIMRRTSEPYAERLRDADVAMWHDLFPDSTHAPLDRPNAPDGDKALIRLQTWLTGGVAAMGSATEAG